MSDTKKIRKLSETPFRKEVLNILSKYKKAISISTIEEELTSYNRITLYRTIKKFLDKGIIHEIKMSGADVHYAVCKDQCASESHNHQHIHFKCHNCLDIYCLEVPQMPQISVPNFEINQLEIQAEGVCENCM